MNSDEIKNYPFVSRCKRKFRPYEDLKIKSSGGIFDLLDNAIKEVYRITDAEKKKCLRIVENHLLNYYTK